MADSHESLFGKLAVRRGFITEAQLDECLTIQNCQKIPAPLELILIERGYIDEVALQELLALSDQGEEALAPESAPPSEAAPETDPIELRQDNLFGRVVVQRSLVSNEQINACVSEQGKLAAQGRRVRLGKLLVAAGHLSMKQVLEVLEYLRTRMLYCERCASLMEIAVEPGKPVPCKACGEALTSPQEITAIKASDLFASDKQAMPIAQAESPKPAASVAREESGYRPVGDVVEVSPTRPKAASPAVPAPVAPAAATPRPATPVPSAPLPGAPGGGKPMVVVGRGGGVRAVLPEAPSRQDRVWHYAVHRKVQGPVNAEAIWSLLAEGKLTQDTLAWRKGLPEWTPIGRIPELRPPATAAPAAAKKSDGVEDLRAKVGRNVGDTMMVRKPALKAPIPPPKLEGYKILEVIGKGGMGIVYKGYQESMDRVVAIKVMVPKYSENEEFVDRFTREARASARVNHPNIIQGIDVREVDGKWCFIMEYADGQRVGDVIRRGGAMSEARALKIVTEVASALEHAHRNQIVHRDVKPDNVIITKEGVAKLCDLGLVKVVSEDTENSKVGDLIGTPDYMSPEQASGKPDVDHRADIYCLGAAWYHMVTGSVPYKGENRTIVLMKHLTEPLEPAMERNPLVSVATSSVIDKMMAKSREDRYQTMSEVLKDLHLLAVGAPPSTAPPAAPEKPAPGKRPVRPIRLRRRRLR